MKTLALLRHAKSEWDDVSVRDFDRTLNARGERGAALMGQHIHEHGIAFDMVLASPARRVRRTLEIALPETQAKFDERLYLASAASLIDTLAAKGGEASTILFAGHNPGLQEMVLELVPPHRENALFDQASVKFPTGAFAVFECAIESWGELRSGVGTLIHFARPRDLDAQLGPKV